MKRVARQPVPKWIAEHLDQLHGSKVTQVPQLGKNLLLVSERHGFLNLGRVRSAYYYDGSGRMFIVQTVNTHGLLRVQLAEETASAPQLW